MAMSSVAQNTCQNPASAGFSPLVLGFAGYSGNGKTTLMERVIALLAAVPLKVAVIKHAHHTFDADQPGKDSWRHRKAGAAEVLVSSSERWALLHERQPNEAVLSLDEEIALLSPADIVLIEGYKGAAINKIEVHRAAAAQPWLYPYDAKIIALVTDCRPAQMATALPIFGLDDAAAVTEFIVQRLTQQVTRDHRCAAI